MYKIRKSFSVKTSRLDPEKVGRRIEQLVSDNDGEITPHIVLADARSKRSPLHDAFDWTDSEAAEKWRIQQARELIRCVQVVFDEDENTTSPLMVNVQSESTGDRVYKRTSDVVQCVSEYVSAIGIIERKIHELETAVADIRRLANESESVARIDALASALATAHNIARALH
jgi:hypothetical protein